LAAAKVKVSQLDEMNDELKDENLRFVHPPPPLLVEHILTLRNRMLKSISEISTTIPEEVVV
jgi:hypothetical protein